MVDPRPTTNAGFGSLTRIGVVTAFGFLVLAGVGAVIVALSSASAERWTAHSQEVRQAHAALFITVAFAESSQRGYLLTGDPTYLRPYLQVKQALPALKANLAHLVADNPRQQSRVTALDHLIDAKMAELESTIVLKRAGDSAGAFAIVKTNRGRDLMTQMGILSGQFDKEELRILTARQTAAKLQRTLLLSLIVVAVVLAGVLAVFITAEARRHASELADQNAELKREVSQRERAEAQLRQSQKMDALGQLTGGVAHDFNNMLAIIVGNLDMVLRRLTDQDGRLRTMVENALTGANRAAALTKRLLAFSRLQPLDPKPTDINKCVGDMSEMLRRALGEPIAVETVLGGGLWRGFIDAPQLESAILNLAVNARDAMPDGGRLTIETSNASLDRSYAEANDGVEPGQYVLVAITDTGAGMTSEVVEKAFDPFFTTKRVGEGTGLGLSQVHGFLKQSNGHVKLYSEPGVGTTVKLYLPRHTGAAAVVETARPRETTAIDGRFTVLVVEDDPGVRGFTVSAARELGFTVIEADGAAVALERLGENPEISVLLTDVVMPVTTGRQLADAALAARPDLRVIYMTGYTRNAIVHNGVLDAGTRLLTKPFTIDQLDRELRDAIADAPAEPANA